MNYLLKGKVKRGGKASYGRLLRKLLKKDGWETADLSGCSGFGRRSQTGLIPGSPTDPKRPVCIYAGFFRFV